MLTWQGRENPPRRKGRVEPSPGADAGGTTRIAEKAAEATYEREPVRMQPGDARGRGRPVIAFGEGPTVKLGCVGPEHAVSGIGIDQRRRRRVRQRPAIDSIVVRDNAIGLAG